jgi:hypothetical protein
MFWSDNARRSEWSKRSACKGLDFIDSAPLIPPEQVPPQSELASQHFNDWMQAFLRGSFSGLETQFKTSDWGLIGGF